MVPELVGVPKPANHSPPRAAMMTGTLHQVSTLLMFVGQPLSPRCAGKGGRGGGPARPALGAGDEGGLLSADEGSRARGYLEVEGEGRAEDVPPQDAGLARRRSTALREALDGEGILGPHVDEALGSAHRVGADGHALDEHVRIGLYLVAVHVGARIALVSVADDVFAVFRWRRAHEFPLAVGREARAAAAAELGLLHLLDHGFRASWSRRPS